MPKTKVNKPKGKKDLCSKDIERFSEIAIAEDIKDASEKNKEAQKKEQEKRERERMRPGGGEVGLELGLTLRLAVPKEDGTVRTLNRSCIFFPRFFLEDEAYMSSRASAY